LFYVQIYQIIAIVITLLGNSAYASDSMKQFQYNLEKITHESTASSAIEIVRGDSVFQTSSKLVADNTQFYIGSVSKHITAYMLLVSLHEQYPATPLSEIINQEVDSLFPSSSILKSIGKDWTAKITLLDLLTHRSGLDVEDFYGEDQEVEIEILCKPADATEILRSVGFNIEKEYSYSNVNYLLIAKLIEEINEDTFDNIFDRLIKLPAGMDSSFCPTSGNYNSLIESKDFANFSDNLGLCENAKYVDISHVVGGGNIISTSSDLIKWGKYLFNSAPKSIVNTMTANYGLEGGEELNLGFYTAEAPQLGKLLTHDGELDSFKSLFAYNTKSDTFVVIWSNNGNDYSTLTECLNSWLLSEPEDIFPLNMHQEQLTWSWTKKLIEENESLKFAASYKEAHPDSEAQGYGPFALVPYNDEVISLGCQTNVWDF
jgi:CubicO group peptidase (beta-lactamase class C family)